MPSLDFFDRVYCIHLPHAERRAAMGAQFAELGIADVTYVHARRPPPTFGMSNMRRNPAAEFGCSLSHIKAVLAALDEGAERPLFLEDDVTFRTGAAARLALALADLPADWGVLYLGGHPRETVTRTGPALVKVGRFSFGEAYSIRRPLLRKFLETWLDRIGLKDAMYDFVLGEFAAANNGYCVYPVITDQLPNVSQIGGAMDDKRPLVDRGWKAMLANAH